jgi:origin recognition complex subunit 4
VVILFILEDIDFYIENTKQVLLYKILDMFQQIQIKFVFLATSQKMDVVDGFEKRIKSRFSHRQILFYD